MKRVASLYLPNLPIDRLRRIEGRSGKSPDPRPLLTQHRSRQRLAIAAACSRARSLGLHCGMAVTQARALVPELDIRAAEPDADGAFLMRLGLFAARRWTPRAAISGPDGLWLDLDGVAHLFGGERRMCERILHFCSRLGFSARIAVAGTTGAAHALARFGGEGIGLCPNGSELDAIAPLPPAALRLEDAAISTARRFGIDSVGELIGMARGPLARRFGKHALMRLDQAVGRAGEPFDPIIPEQPPQALLRLLEPIASAEAIEQVLSDLVAMLIVRLERQGRAVRRLVLICERVDGEEQRLAIGLARPSRDAGHLLHLLGMKIETIDPGFGIEAMRLTAERCEPLPAQQIASDEPPSDLPQLIDRIAGMIGSRQVFHCSAMESDVPERSVLRIAPLDHPNEWGREWPRPVRLLVRPEPVDKVLAALPDQPPMRFSWRGQMHRVRKADGPERIYGEWWKRTAEAAAVRDYFQVEDEQGGRFWLFRSGDGVDPRTGDLSWFMHGVFG
jgi:protein ImuB